MTPTKAALLTACLALATLQVPSHAQRADAPEWKEVEVAPPSAFKTDALLPFQIGQATSLRFGVDPDTLTVGEDGVVRYVMVAQSASGASNVWYEGVRCTTGQVKTYAHWAAATSTTAAGWQIRADADWRPLVGSSASRPALVLAREALCNGSTVNGDERRILRDLRLGKPRD
ncbi:MAG: CNP1-like family protein [Serpentinimonas sp.]|jgi:hypothetical protein|nr:CNP1-like family protein [Serpentinimonas sp.]